MEKGIYWIYIAAVTTVLVLFAAVSCIAQATAFSYQGKLNDAGAPANGTYEIQFKLFKDAGGTIQVAQTIDMTAVSVVQGIFTVNLDFTGTTVWEGGSRYLEVSVRRSSSDPFELLLPRQQIMSAPYSIKSLSADSAKDSERLGGISATSYLLTAGDGSALTNLNADSISTGTVSDLRLSSNVPKLDANNTFTGTNSFNGLTLTGGQITGLRLENSTTNPALKLAQASAAAGQIYYNTTDQTLRVFDGTQWRTFVSRDVHTTLASGSSSWQCASFGTTGIFQAPGQSVTFTKLSDASRLKVTYVDDFTSNTVSGSVEVRQILSPSTSASLTPLFLETVTSFTRPRMIGYITNMPAGTYTFGLVFQGNTSSGAGLNCTRPPSGRFVLEVEEVP